MYAVTDPCPICQSALTGTGNCLACLLRVGLDCESLDFDGGAAGGNPTVFGDFQIIRREDGSPCELGRGAMGVTYRAMDNVLHRSVALKVITAPELLEASSAVRERFLREARGAAGLHHPNVAEVFQFGTLPETGHAYYAMELIDGETLEARVRRNGPLETLPALHVAVQVAHALTAAAERHLVHRDLKPGNIMLSSGGPSEGERVTVIDFGLAKTVTGAPDAMNLTHGGFVGTPMFASPEQFRGDPADARSDIYSLGVTLWYALTGEVPFAGRTIEEIRRAQCETALPLRQLRIRKLPACVVTLLQRALALDPAGRPPSAAAMLVSLEQCQAAVARGAVRRRMRQMLVIVACASASLAALAGWWMIRSGSSRFSDYAVLASSANTAFGGTTKATAGSLWKPGGVAAETRPTRNAPAYLNYLRGIALMANDAGSPTPLHQAEDAFNEAVRMDPAFAAAWAELSIVHSTLFFTNEKGSQARLTLARQALETAEKLDPNSGEVFLARGFYHYHGEYRFDEAIRDFKQASERLPDRADAFYALGLVQRRQGYWDECLTNFEHAARVQPMNPAYTTALQATDRMLGRYREALEISDRRMAVSPGDPKGIIFKALIYQCNGDLSSAAGLLDPLELQELGTGARAIQIDQWFYERRYERVIEVSLRALRPGIVREVQDRVDVLFNLGLARKWSGDLTGMAETMHEARELLSREPPDTMENPYVWLQMAQIDAALGDRETALREGERARSIPVQDPFEVLTNELGFAQLCAQLGDADRAIAALPRLLRSPGSELSAGLLRLDPIWDPIRTDARFAKLAKGIETDGSSR